MRLRVLFATICTLALCMLGIACGSQVQSVPNPPEVGFLPQQFQPPENCLPCHQRQFNELRSAVKSGYRNVSPLFNGLESAGNLVNGGLLRPVYSDSTVVLPAGTLLNTNMYTSPILKETRQVQAGFCFTCHNANIEVLGNDQTLREIPQLGGLGTCNPAPPAGQQCFQPQLFRPLRDYVLVDANGNQVLPATPGADPPAGAQPSLGAAGITCDFCPQNKMDWVWDSSDYCFEILQGCTRLFGRRRTQAPPPAPAGQSSGIGTLFSWRQAHRNVVRSDTLNILQQ